MELLSENPKCSCSFCTNRREINRLRAANERLREERQEAMDTVGTVEAENDRLRAANEALRDELRYFAVDETAFYDPDEPGNPYTSVGMGVTREHAARLRDLCGTSDEQEATG